MHGRVLQVHGSAPDIASQDMANPLAMVLSAAMMCRYGLNLPQVTPLLPACLPAPVACTCAVSLPSPALSSTGIATE